MSVFRVAVSDGNSTTPLCFRAFSGNMGGGDSVVDPKSHLNANWHQNTPCDYCASHDSRCCAARRCPTATQARAHVHLRNKTGCRRVWASRAAGSQALLQKYTPCLIAMKFHVPLLKAAGAAPPVETLQLLVDASYEPKSHSLEKITGVVTSNGITDTIWEHTTMNSGAHTGDTMSCHAGPVV